jgi:hypothetical protein
LKALDLQYHDLRADKCLARRVGLQTLIDNDDVDTAKTEPPTTTRAYFRGRCLAKWPADIVAANWDSLVFDIGRDPLRRVPFPRLMLVSIPHVVCGVLLPERSSRNPKYHDVIQEEGADGSHFRIRAQDLYPRRVDHLFARSG